jgi:hypothetical protein
MTSSAPNSGPNSECNTITYSLFWIFVQIIVQKSTLWVCLVSRAKGKIQSSCQYLVNNTINSLSWLHLSDKLSLGGAFLASSYKAHHAPKPRFGGKQYGPELCWKLCCLCSCTPKAMQAQSGTWAGISKALICGGHFLTSHHGTNCQFQGMKLYWLRVNIWYTTEKSICRLQSSSLWRVRDNNSRREAHLPCPLRLLNFTYKPQKW